MLCPISIVIPTCERGPLLARTLASLSECKFPAALHRVVIVENGGRGTARDVVNAFADRLPVLYEHVASPNKSRALNHVLYRSGDELMIFFDDDVRVLPTTLAAYATAAERRVSGFWGGRCCVDYEQEPPAWIKRYLPPSAIGWSLGDAPCPLTRPIALGFNWAAFSRELKQACGFDEERGPGTFSRGQETDMQLRLLQSGIEGHYLPEAVVWHYVPASRCSEEWALRRSRQTARFDGVNISRKSLPKRLRHDVFSAVKITTYNTLLTKFPTWFSSAQQFHLRYQREWFIGVREGIHHAQPAHTPPPAHNKPAYVSAK